MNIGDIRMTQYDCKTTVFRRAYRRRRSLRCEPITNGQRGGVIGDPCRSLLTCEDHYVLLGYDLDATHTPAARHDGARPTEVMRGVDCHNALAITGRDVLGSSIES